MTGNGYIHALVPDHPKADKRGRVYEHIVIAERALGKSLPLGVEVHHADGNGFNNNNDNLVVCENHAYHLLLHRRERALRACGHANYLRCRHCREWDDPVNLKVFERSKEGVDAYHKSCHAQAEHNRLHEKGRTI